MSLDGTSAANHRAYEQLRDSIRHLHEAALGPQGVDFTFSIYKIHREKSLLLCRALVDNSSQFRNEAILSFVFLCLSYWLTPNPQRCPSLALHLEQHVSPGLWK
jgi:hypothetical protein